MSTHDAHVIRNGSLAYFRALNGAVVPVKVLGIDTRDAIGTARADQHLLVKVTGSRPGSGYRKGETVSASRAWIEPRCNHHLSCGRSAFYGPREFQVS